MKCVFIILKIGTQIYEGQHNAVSTNTAQITHTVTWQHLSDFCEQHLGKNKLFNMYVTCLSSSNCRKGKLQPHCIHIWDYNHFFGICKFSKCPNQPLSLLKSFLYILLPVYDKLISLATAQYDWASLMYFQHLLPVSVHTQLTFLMMACNKKNGYYFGYCLSSWVVSNTTFLKLFLSSDLKLPLQLSPLERLADWQGQCTMKPSPICCKFCEQKEHLSQTKITTSGKCRENQMRNSDSLMALLIFCNK